MERSESFTAFAVGDRVWVNGNKPGYVQYLGETQFAPGIWAGVGLDEATGKNDGQVDGVKYFDCEPLRGIFIRPHRLTRTAGTPPSLEQGDSPRTPGSSSKSPGSSISPTGAKHSCSKLKPGERVYVNSSTGCKSGILRYVGPTEFAAGEWAGVELDQPMGKNDGLVGGKRYFECDKNHGLFTPMHKICRAGGSGLPFSRPPSSLLQRSYSRESISSTTSSIMSSKGVRAKQTIRKTPRIPSTPAVAALEEALKEKVQHIEQLLKERDLERNEYALATSKSDQMEKQVKQLRMKLESCKQEKEAEVTHLQMQCQKAETEAKSIFSLLDDEKRKMEDLQFRLDEESIFKTELETQAERDCQKIEELSERLKEEIFMKSRENSQSKELLEHNSEYSTASDFELQQKLTELSMLSKEKESLASEVKKLETHIKEQERKFHEERTKTESLFSTLQEKSEQIVKLTADLQQHSVVIAANKQLEKQLLDLKTYQNKNKSYSDNKICQLSAKVDDLSSQLQEKETLLQEEQKQVSVFQKHLEEKDIGLSNFKQSLQEAENKQKSLIAAHNVHLKQLENKLICLQGDQVRSTNEVDQKVLKYSKEAENLLGQLMQKEQFQRQLEQQVKIHESQAQEKEKTINELSLQLKEMSKKLSEMQQQSTSVLGLKKEIDQIKKEADGEKSQAAIMLSSLEKEKENLSSLVEKLHLCVTNREEKVAALEIGVSEKNQQIDVMQVELSKARSNFDILSNSNANELSTLQHRIAQVKMESERLAKERESSLEQEKENLTTTIENLTKNVTNKEEMVAMLEKRVLEKDHVIKDIEDQLNKTRADIDFLNSNNATELGSLDERIVQVKNETEQLAKERENLLLKEKEQLLSTIEQLKLDGVKKEETVTSLTNMVSERDCQIEDMQGQLNKARTDIDLFNNNEANELGTLHDQIAQAKIESEKLMKEQENTLVQEKEKLTSVIEELKLHLANIEEQKTSLEKSLTGKESEINDSQAQLSLSKKEFDSLNDKHTTEISNLNNQLSDVKTEIENLTKEKEVLERRTHEKESLDVTLNEKNTLLSKKDASILSLEQALTQKNNQIFDLQKSLNQTESSLTKYREEVSQQNVMLEQKIKEISQKNEAAIQSKDKILEVLKKEIEQYKQTAASSSEAADNSVKQLKNLQTSIAGRDSQMLEFRKQLESKQKEIEEIKLESAKTSDLDNSKFLDMKSQQERSFFEKEKILQEKTEVLKKENDQLLQQLSAFDAACKELKETKDSLLNEKIAQQVIVKEKEDKLESLQKEVDRMHGEFSIHKQELQQKLDVSQMELEAMKEFKKQMDMQHAVNEELQQQVIDLENEKNKLEDALKDSYGDAQKNFQLEDTISQLMREKKENTEKVAEAGIQQRHLEETRNHLREKNLEYEQLNDELLNMQDRFLEMNVFVVENEKLLQENNLLKTTVQKQKAELDQQQTGDPGSEKEAFISQIEFLKSIIADLHNSNADLKKQQEEPAIEKDINLNGVKKRPPRLFCDICDMFDLHDTEDCPKQCYQEQDETESMAAKKPRGERCKERPYCNNCGIFGHWTLDCDQEETF